MNGFADCSADYVCPVCNEVARPASEHTYISEDTATCTKEGHMLSTCTTCGHEHIGQATPAKGHSFGKATCISLPICSVCGAEDTTAKLAACVHVWVSNGNGTHTGYCTSGRETHNVCNISCRPKSAATCTEDSVCSICSGVITPAFGHTFEGECTEYQYCKTCNALSDREPGHVRKTLIKIGNVKLIKLAICEDCGIWMYQYTIIAVSIIALGVLLFFFRKFVLALPDSTDPFFKRIFRGRRFRR